MKYNLDFALNFNDAPEHKSLYKAAIFEINDDGSRASDDFIPWRFSLWFTAISAKYIFGHQRMTDDYETSELINIKIIPDPTAQRFLGPTFSFFGTERLIEEFKLQVQPGDDEQLRLLAFPSYTYEGPEFLDETTSDEVVFIYTIKLGDFDRLKEMILGEKVSDISFHASGIDGFYSRWSPTITTDHIKIWSPHGPDLEIPSDATGRWLKVGGDASANEFSLNFGKEIRLAGGQVTEDDHRSYEDDETANPLNAIDLSEPARTQMRKENHFGYHKLFWVGAFLVAILLWFLNS